MVRRRVVRSLICAGGLSLQEDLGVSHSMNNSRGQRIDEVNADWTFWMMDWSGHHFFPL